MKRIFLKASETVLKKETVNYVHWGFAVNRLVFSRSPRRIGNRLIRFY